MKEGFGISLFALILVSAFLITALFFLFIRYAEEIKSVQGNETINESRIEVIDGDTFKLNGDIIRLICIDAPERGKQGYEDAREFLASLIEGREVRLESDVDDKDEYGRLLRYVYVVDDNTGIDNSNTGISEGGGGSGAISESEGVSSTEIFVNREMARQGYASVFRYGNNTRRCGEMEA